MANKKNISSSKTVQEFYHCKTCNTRLECSWAQGKAHELKCKVIQISQMLKTNFLMELRFVEKSKEMEKALKDFRGKGDDLQGRLDCIMQAGLDRKDAIQMIKTAPQILNQRKEVIEMKINYLVNDAGYPLSSLVSFLTYTIPTLKLRWTMYNWLKDQGKVGSTLSLSTFIGCSDKLFVKRYVGLHPRGPEVWQDLKKKIVPK